MRMMHGLRRQLLDRLMLENVFDRKSNAPALEHRDHPNREDRIPSEAEEIIPDSDPVPFESLLPDLAQRPLDLITGRYIDGALSIRSLRRRERQPIDLPVGSQR